MKLKHLTISTRLRLGFVTLIVALLTVATVGLFALQRSHDALTHIVEVNLKKIELLEEMSNSVHVAARIIRTAALLNQQPELAEEQLKKVAEVRSEYDAAFAALQTMPLDEAGHKFIAELQAVQVRVRPLNNKFIAMARAHDESANSYLIKTAAPATEEWQGLIREFILLQNKKSAHDAMTARDAFGFARTVMIVFSVIATALGAFLSVQIRKSISVPLRAAIVQAETVAQGDLTKRVAVHAKDITETGHLLRALQDMTGGLNGLIHDVREGAERLAAGSQEIADGNIDLSKRTEQQAGVLEETASSMEQITATVQQNSETADKASELATTAATKAKAGGGAVQNAVLSMGNISESSRKIVEIIGVIDSIAFQTNILALNAAVEAARAGEQGRGFAVVAQEVRALAQRSASAAREIQTLINNSVAQVAAGVESVDQAGHAMEEVVASISTVSQLIGEIALASKEQADGVSQVHAAVVEMDKVTQKNSALVEEVAATAANLNNEAQHLASAVVRFKVLAAA